MDQHQETLRSDTDPAIKRRALLRVQQALIAAQEIGDEKLQIVQQVQDLIENKSRQLDLDYRNLGTCCLPLSLSPALTGVKLLMLTLNANLIFAINCLPYP